MLLPEVAAYLVTTGVLTAMGTDLFLGRLPAAPDVATAIFEYPGEMDEANLGTGTIRLEFPRIQVVCRNVKDEYAAPRLLAQRVSVALMAVMNQNLSGVRYLAIEALHAPFFLRRDENDRVEIVASYKVTKEPSAS